MSMLRTISRHKARIIVAVCLVFIGLHLTFRSTYNTSAIFNKIQSSANSKSSPASTPQHAINGPVIISDDKIIPVNNNHDSESPSTSDVESIINKPLSNPPGDEYIEPQDPNNDANHVESSEDIPLQSIRDYTVFFNDLEDFKPKSESVKNKYITEKAKEKFSTSSDFLFSKKYLEEVLDLSPEFIKDLKDSHYRYVTDHINKLVENFGVSTFGNILKSDPEWSQYQNSKGYVLVGGGQYSWLSYLVIKQIRVTGSNLPIELFIASKDDYDKKFCENLLPLYNARCNVFDGELSKDLKSRFNLGGYQYKMLAILSSKFENVLYVDSDNFPTKNVDYLFSSDLFLEKGLILWPDAWARTTNPAFYDIAGVKVKENKLRYSDYDYQHAEGEGDDKKVKPLSEYTFEDSNYHDFEGTLPNPTSETGMFMINKTSHLRTLLLALYYNIFGPHYYYPLLTQGSAGEGDKETFIAAAHVMKEPWFQTLKQFKWTGYISETDNQFTSKALGHFDPIQSQDPNKVKDENKIDIIFMHLSYPKYYPNWLVDNYDLIYKDSGNHIRMYEAIYDNVGYDFDLRALQLFTQALCPNYYFDQSGDPIDGEAGVKKSIEYMGKYLNYVSNDEETEKKRCSEVFIPHLKWLKETTKFPNTLDIE